MKVKSIFSVILALNVSMVLVAQNKNILLEDIWVNRTFSPEWVWGINSMNDGIHYTSLNRREAEVYITKYAYESGDSISMLLNSELLDGLSFNSYTFSSDEQKILLPTETESIYRHSTQSKYFIFDRVSETTQVLSEGKQRLAQFSPDASKVAFVRQNNLYLKDLVDQSEKAITQDGEVNKIINGASDWVYEEEFGFDQAYQWNSSGTKIAYYKFNEESVSEFSMDVFQELYPSQNRFKYPKAGEKNAIVSIHIYDLKSKTSIRAEVETESEFYIPRIKWTQDENVLSLQIMNRHQNKLDLILVNATDGSAKIIYTETDEAYLDINDNLTFLKNGKHFIWTSEKSGYNHIYLFSIRGKQLRKITKGNFDVTDFYGIDENSNTIYFASAEQSPLHRNVYSVQLSGKNKTLLGPKSGTNSANFSANYKYFINQNSTANTPYCFSLFNIKGDEIRTLKDNAELKKNLSDFNLSQKEFFNFKTTEGIKLNGWMMKPSNFDTNKEYPLFMYVYGGPGSQQVTDAWGGSNYMWFQMLTQMGYIVACVDNRGTGARGAKFKKSTYLELGKLETQDQIEANRYLADLPYVDDSRIGIFGWSYGGYMSSLCLLKGC
jgi:dipeptidyl-peptidase-4